MKIRIASNGRTDSALYIAEMLTMWGTAYWEVETETKNLDAGTFPALIVPADVSLPGSVIKTYAGDGGHALLIAPSRGLLTELGMPLPIQYGDDGEVSFLRQTRPLLGTFSRYGLEIVGPRVQAISGHYAGGGASFTLPETATVWAYMYELGHQLVDRPALWTIPCGNGHITVFAYDLAACFRDLRQGRPRYAGYRPNYDDICRPSHLFGPRWLEQAQTKHLPLADFHPMLLTCLCERFWPLPPPRLWQLPGLHHSAILLSGDEDGSPPEESEEICTFMDSIDTSMTVYVHMQNTRTPLSHLRQLISRGHSISVHPYPIEAGESGNHPGGDLLGKLEWCVREFRNRYGLPTPAIRNHRLFWTGYMEIPRMWERLGVKADCNYGPLFSDRGFSSIYGACSGVLPVKFIDENWRLINVLQSPLGLSDDAWFSATVPKTMACTPELAAAFTTSLIADTLQPLGTVFTVIFHPGNYVKFAAPAEQAILNQARAMGTVLMAEMDWLDFWQMRRSWQVASMQRRDSTVTYTLKGQQQSRRLSLSLSSSITRATVDQKPLDSRLIPHFGEPRTLVSLPDGATEMQVEIGI